MRWSARQTIFDIYDEVDPLDDWLANGTTIENTQLWVDAVDPEVISVDWYVNGQLVAPDHGESLDLAEFRSAPATYTVRAHAYDDSGTARRRWVRSSIWCEPNLNALQQDITWTVDFHGSLVAGDYNFDLQVDAEDFMVWKTNHGSSQKLAADGNHNGIVDAADYAIWRNNVGSGAAAAECRPKLDTRAVRLGAGSYHHYRLKFAGSLAAAKCVRLFSATRRRV